MQGNKVKSTLGAFIYKVNALSVSAKNTLCNRKAEGYVDSGIKILISVVIGTLLLSGLYSLFNDTIMPTVTKKVEEMFNYAG